MSLEIKVVTKVDTTKPDLDPKGVVRVMSPGTIFQLFRQIKKIQRDHRRFQASLGDKEMPTALKEQLRKQWIRNSKMIVMLED